MPLRKLLCLLLVPLLLSGCGLSEQQKADYAAVQRSGVSPAVYDKMLHGDYLSVSDVEALSRAHVNDGVILRYLRNTQAVYTLSSNDVKRLSQSGVSPSVVDYMLQTQQLYPPVIYAAPVYYGPAYGPYSYPYPYPRYYR